MGYERWRKFWAERELLSRPPEPAVGEDGDVAGQRPGDGIAEQIHALASRVIDAANLWLVDHMEILVLLVVIAGFVLRLRRGNGTYLNADEAMIMLAPWQASLSGVLQSMLVHPHGPIPNLLLHYLTVISSSELVLRMPSILAGALIPYVVYRWGADVFDKTTGLLAAIIIGVLPGDDQPLGSAAVLHAADVLHGGLALLTGPRISPEIHRLDAPLGPLHVPRLSL